MKNKDDKEQELLDRMPGWIRILMEAIRIMPDNKKEIK
jgi:hypothetical protein